MQLWHCFGIDSNRLLTVTLSPEADDSRTVSIFMWRPARRPQVTWNAV